MWLCSSSSMLKGDVGDEKIPKMSEELEKFSRGNGRERFLTKYTNNTL